MFQGAAHLTLDAKGRLAVPTRHRESLSEKSAGKLVLTAHPHGCLLLYPQPAWAPIRAQIMTFSSFDKQASLWKRLLVGFAQDMELDATGRLLVAPELRNFAGLEKDVMLVGQGSHFELWSLNAWEKQLAELAAQSDKSPPGMENFAL